MNPALVLAAVLFLLPFLGLIAFCLSPGLRIAYWIQRAQTAFGSREFETAEACYQKLSLIQAKLRDPARQATIEFVSEHGLGLCRQAQDDFAASERHLLRAADLWDEGVEVDRGIKAQILAELVIAQSAQGKTALSGPTMHRLKEVCEAADEDEIHQVAELVTAAAHGASFRNFQNLAFEIVRVAQTLLERTEDWHNGALAHTQISLASFHMGHCEYGPARELIEKAVAAAGEELDQTDKDNAYFNLGWICALSGNLDAAKEAFERSLQIRSQEQGEEHWHTSITISALADVHRIAGNYLEAKMHSDGAWRIQSDQLPADDAILAGTAVNRSLLLIELGDLEEADRMLASASHVAQGRARRPLLAAVRLFQGVSCLTRGDHHRANEFLQQALEIAEDAYGTGHRMTLDHRTILGENLIELGRFQEAESLLTETLALRESLPDVSVIDLADLLCILGELYLETGRLPDAESAVLRARNQIDDRVSATHLIRAEIHKTLGRISHARSDFDAALEHFRHAFEVRGQVQPPDHPRLIKLLEARARTLSSIGDTAKADEDRRRAEQIRRRFLGTKGDNQKAQSARK